MLQKIFLKMERYMQNILRDIPLFVEVARQKSFSRAAEALDMPVSTLSRRIAALEKRLSLCLMHRTSRTLELTPEGMTFFIQCETIASDVANAIEALTEHRGNASGKVRLSVSGDFYHCYLADALCSFALAWPDICLDIQFSERWVNLMTDPVDLDIRIGEMPDSALKVRKMANVHASLYAAPELFTRYPKPVSPRELADLPCIGLQHLGNVWKLCNGQTRITVPLRPVHSFNSMSASLQFAAAGFGVTCLAPSLAAPLVQSGYLEPVLPDWQQEQAGAYIVMAANQLPLRTRLLVDHLVEYMSSLARSDGAGNGSGNGAGNGAGKGHCGMMPIWLPPATL